MKRRWKSILVGLVATAALCGAVAVVLQELTEQERAVQDLEAALADQEADHASTLASLQSELDSTQAAAAALSDDLDALARMVGSAGFGTQDLADRVDEAERQLRVLDEEVLDNNGGLATLMRQFTQRLGDLEQCVSSIERAMNSSSSYSSYIFCPL